MADPLAVIDVTEAKAALGLLEPDADIDSHVEAYAAEISRRFDDLCGPIVVRPDPTLELHDGGRPTIRLVGVSHHGSAFDLVTDVSVIEYVGTVGTPLDEELPGGQPASGYLLDARRGILERRGAGAGDVFAEGRRNVVVEYTAGRFENTDAVDVRFKQPAAVMFAHLWRAERSAGSAVFSDQYAGGVGVLGTGVASFAVPRRVLEMLGEELRDPHGIGVG